MNSSGIFRIGAIGLVLAMIGFMSYSVEAQQNR